MPVYEYQCECGFSFDEFTTSSKKAVTKCPKCDSKKVTKKISSISSGGCSGCSHCSGCGVKGK